MNAAKFELEYIRTGGQAAFQQVFERYYPGMVEYAYRMLADQEAGEDLVQEIFIDLWNNIQSHSITTSLQGYLYTSVRNRCLNYLKSLEVTNKQYILDISISLDSEESFRIFDEEEEERMHGKAKTILSQLPEKMQKIFQLKVLEGYSYAEIAAEMDISVNTVKTQLKRARKKITELHELIVLFWIERI